MLKSRKQRQCHCGSGKKLVKCCESPAALLYQLQDVLLNQRQCGDCQACCELLGVVELGKPYATKCEHQCPTGCAIYANRPKSCRDFGCNWKLPQEMATAWDIEAMQDGWRPDKSGIMVSLEQSPAGLVLSVYEVWEGAHDAMSLDLRIWLRPAITQMMMAGHIQSVIYIPYGCRLKSDFQPDPKYGPVASTNEAVRPSIAEATQRQLLALQAI